jgi:hypothetical protein
MDESLCLQLFLPLFSSSCKGLFSWDVNPAFLLAQDIFELREERERKEDPGSSQTHS